MLLYTTRDEMTRKPMFTIMNYILKHEWRNIARNKRQARYWQTLFLPATLNFSGSIQPLCNHCTKTIHSHVSIYVITRHSYILLSELRHGEYGGNGIIQATKWQKEALNRGTLNKKSDVLTTKPLCPTEVAQVSQGKLDVRKYSFLMSEWLEQITWTLIVLMLTEGSLLTVSNVIEWAIINKKWHSLDKSIACFFICHLELVTLKANQIKCEPFVSTLWFTYVNCYICSNNVCTTIYLSQRFIKIHFQIFFI